MIANERQRKDRPLFELIISDGRALLHKIPVPDERVVQLPHVRVFNAAPDGLPHLVLGDRVHVRLSGELDIPALFLAVNNFTEKHCTRIVSTHAVDHGPPEFGGHGVRSVEPPPGDPAIQPILHDVHHHVGHVRVGMIQLSQVEVPLPRDRHDLPVVRVRLHRSLLRPCTRPLNRLGHQRMLRSHVVKHTVQHHLQAALRALRHQVIKIVQRT